MPATVVVSPYLNDAVLSALREYRTQFPAFGGGPLRIVEHPAVRGFEVAWWLRG